MVYRDPRRKSAADVEAALTPDPRPDPLAELAAILDDVTDPALRARLVRVHRALRGEAPEPANRPSLAPREVDALRLVAVGATNVEIAARLGLSTETVKAYLRTAMRKLDVHTRTAAAYAARQADVLWLPVATGGPPGKLGPRGGAEPLPEKVILRSVAKRSPARSSQEIYIS
ncbi:helix-turn-helix transcriptional regulator [Amycolatopsis sp. cmx-4-61]|uniref:helix-turn-helix transcriptional regulator n=1 Tax=Amycolatopsis sp. cmx-4-61 TaxID=2790937 RepID=UPI003979FD4F